MDACLGYYKGTSETDRQTMYKDLGFNIHSIITTPQTKIEYLYANCEKCIQSFINDMFNNHTLTNNDKLSISKFVKYTKKFLSDNFVKDGTSDIECFKLLISRYLLLVSVVHGVEHYAMNSTFAPFNLPQRIRKNYNKNIKIEDYSFLVDKQNAYIGNYIFTQVKSNINNPYYWDKHTSSIYKFTRRSDINLCDNFITNIKDELVSYDNYFRKKINDVILNTGKDIKIPVENILNIPISISM
jgi:hypothetical protein